MIGTADRLVVGIGELVVADQPDQVIVAHALGSCIAVCLFDPVARVAAMLHFLLPDSRINLDRARTQPAAFADTGIPLLFEAASARGFDKRRAQAHLAGGADIGGWPGSKLHVGRQNAAAATNLLHQHGVLVTSQDVGGTRVRTVRLSAGDGRLQIFSGPHAGQGVVSHRS